MITTTAINVDEVLGRLRAKMPPRQFERLMLRPEKHASSRELFRDACVMKRAGISPGDQEIVLRARFREYYRPLDDREIDNAIANANGAPSSGRRWPVADPDHWKVLTKNSGGSLDRLRAMSPVPNPGALTSGTIIDRLFKADDLLCFGDSDHRAVTEPRAYFLGDEGDFPLIVPNAMSAPSGKTQAGKDSPRTLSNAGPRVYAVIEFDSGSRDEQSSVILHLADVGPSLRLVVFSGSKSLHAWFEMLPLSADDVEKFLRYSAHCGADTATFNPVQFARTPNAWRDAERQQITEFLK